MKRLRGLLALGTALLFCSSTQGRVFIIRDTSDSTAPTSLRGAIIAANRGGGHNTIMLAAPANPRTHAQPVYRLTISGSNEDKSQTGDLDITGGVLTITGISSNTVIDATELGDRVFQIFTNAHLTLLKLTIQGGQAPGSDLDSIKGLAHGGAIHNHGILTLKNCVLRNNASGPGSDNQGNGPGNSAGNGGAIFNSGTLSINRCLFQENFCGDGINSSSGGNGGAIANSGNCTATLCTFAENRTGTGAARIENSFGEGGNGGSGGAIFNSGIMLLKDCSISANVCAPGADGGTINLFGVIFGPGLPPGANGGEGGSGGGIYNSGRMEVDNSTVSGNATGTGGNGGNFGGPAGGGGNGGGIYNSGELTLNSITLSGNSCGNGGAGSTGAETNGVTGALGGSGGGIYNGNQLALTSCTIALNQTGNGGIGGQGQDPNAIADSGAAGAGGGVFVATDGTTMIRNTLVALNTTGTGTLSNLPGAGLDAAGTFVSQGFNLVGIIDGSTGFAEGVDTDLTGTLALPVNPLLGPLQMNGGSTPTHALLPGSPAIDQGDSFKIHQDQRGARRPVNVASISNSTAGDGSDIGAFEAASK